MILNYVIKDVTFTHLADAFIQSDLQCIQAINWIGNWTHNLLRCKRNALTIEPQEHNYLIYHFALSKMCVKFP